MTPHAPETPSRRLPPRSRISHYEILSELGQGGMGLVYRAKDLSLGRDVALKCVRPEHAENRDLHRRLLREARAASRLSHPAIVTILEVFEHEGFPWIAMELVNGITLRKRLTEQGPIPVSELLRHAEDLTDALRAAHAKNVLHRDVNPNNVLLTEDGRARLTDFGLARIYVPPGEMSRATTPSSYSREGRVVGTPGYMSPEQLLGRHVDPRSDIFSLGAVFYEMCTGKPAFSVTSDGDLTDAILNREPVAINRLNYEVPEEFERIVRKSLAKRPDERYQSAQDLAADLRVLRRGLESGSMPRTSRDRSLSGPGILPRRHPYLTAAVLALGLGAIGVGGFVGWRQWIAKADQLPPLPALRPQPLTSGQGFDTEPKISPDGSFVAYASNESGDPEIWIVDVQGRQSLRLTHNPGADTSPAWFPDGSAVAFVSDSGGAQAVWKVPRLGGTASMLVPDALDPAVSPEGGRIAFVRPETTGHLRVWVASVDDPSHATQVSHDDAGFWDHRHPAWSPDGRLICYEDFNNLWRVSAAGGKSARLTTQQNRDRNPGWTSDGKRIYFSSLSSGTRSLWRVPSDGRAPQRVTLGTAVEGEPSVSRDGRRLAYSTRTDERHLVLLDLVSGTRTLLVNQRFAESPRFAPDGSAVYFLSRQPDAMNLWSVPLAGRTSAGQPRRVTDLASEIGTYSLSPDGRVLAYHGNIEGKRDISTVALAGGIPTKLMDDAAADLQPSWSPDASRLAFSSDRDGRQHVWIMPIRNGKGAGPSVQLTRGDSTDAWPTWSPRGDRVAYLRSSPGASGLWDVWVLQADGRSQPVRVTTGADARGVSWTADPDRLLVSGTWGGLYVHLREVRLAGGPGTRFHPEVVFGDAEALGDFALSADGSLLAYMEERSHGDIWVLETTEGAF